MLRFATGRHEAVVREAWSPYVAIPTSEEGRHSSGAHHGLVARRKQCKIARTLRSVHDSLMCMSTFSTLSKHPS